MEKAPLEYVAVGCFAVGCLGAGGFVAGIAVGVGLAIAGYVSLDGAAVGTDVVEFVVAAGEAAFSGRIRPSSSPLSSGEGLSNWHSLMSVSSIRNCLLEAARKLKSALLHSSMAL